MKENNISILSTRPLAASVMNKAASKGITIDTVSFIDTKTNIDEATAHKIKQLASKEASIVFTSMNAAEAVIDCLEAAGASPSWTIYTLGGITQTIIEQYFTNSDITGTANNAAELAELIIADEIEAVTFFCGNQRRDELPIRLQEESITVDEVEVYETIETPVKLDKQYNAVLFFSPSAVKSFFSANKIDDKTVLFAIGTTTAREIKQLSGNKVLVGAYPNKELLADSAIDYFL